MSTSTRSTPRGKGSGTHKAGAFDIRTFIGTLLGIYGVVLTLMGLLGDKELSKTGGVNANLWVGLVLLVVSATFLVWARVRPMRVPDEIDTEGMDNPHHP